jgi:hypothetical protein
VPLWSLPGQTLPDSLQIQNSALMPFSLLIAKVWASVIVSLLSSCFIYEVKQFLTEKWATKHHPYLASKLLLLLLDLCAGK